MRKSTTGGQVPNRQQGALLIGLENNHHPALARGGLIGRKLDPLQSTPYSYTHQRRRRRGQHSNKLEPLLLPHESNTGNAVDSTRIRDRDEEEEVADEEYSYQSMSVDQQIDTDLMKCNSPFLDAIFGASEGKKDIANQRSHWDRQRLAYDILSEPVNISSMTNKGRASPTSSNMNSYTTTTETQSDISSISEVVPGMGGPPRSGNPRAGTSKRWVGGKDGDGDKLGKDAAAGPSISASAPGSVTRIIAPNVEKLPAHSVVELVLQGDEVVSVLCSVDTLKMRSEYFYEHLSALERKTDEQSSIGTVPLVIDDPSPFEAAAYLESMHDGGKSLSGRGTWSYHFARLSVQWRVEDLIAESASILDNFMDNILKTVEHHHWRTNPSILTGRPIAVLPANGRQGGNKPDFIHGIVMESPPGHHGDGSTTYVTLRVRVESNGSPSNTPRAGPSPAAAASTGADLTNASFLARRESLRIRAETGEAKTKEVTKNPPLATVSWQDFETTVSQDEDFLVDSRLKVLIKHKDEWIDPDELFLEEAKSLLASSDGVYFWEMLKAILELPPLQSQCKGRIQSPQHIVDILVRHEFRCLWSYQANKKLPGFLPKKYALQLTQHAFCS